MCTEYGAQQCVDAIVRDRWSTSTTWSVESAFFVFEFDMHKRRTPPLKRPLPVRCVASHKLSVSIPIRDSTSCWWLPCCLMLASFVLLEGATQTSANVRVTLTIIRECAAPWPIESRPTNVIKSLRPNSSQTAVRSVAVVISFFADACSLRQNGRP